MIFGVLSFKMIANFSALIVIILPLITGCNKIFYPKNVPLIASDFHSNSHVDGQRRYQLHQGIDILAKNATNILAVADGTVLKEGAEKCWGLTIAIDHGKAIDGENIIAIYSHLSGILVKNSEDVKRGQLIGILDKNQKNYECLIGIKSD